MTRRRKQKRKKTQVATQALVRPRLDAIFACREGVEPDDDKCLDEVSTLMAEVGRGPVMDALLKKLESASDAEWGALMSVISKLGDRETIAYLWRIVRRSKMSLGVKSTALVILKQLGEDVDLSDPGAYFSPRDVKLSDVTEIAHLARHSMHMIIKELQKASSVGEVEGLIQHLIQIAQGAGAEPFPPTLIEELGKTGQAGAADFLLAITHTTTQPKVRQAARDALLKLSGRGVFPQSSIIKAFIEERFYAAYCTDPANPWQQQVTMAWEWPSDVTQAMVFLLDFGFPWRGSIKDMFVTRYLPKRKLRQELIEAGNEQRRIPFARARQFIVDALESNRRYRVRLPEEYHEFRGLIERRIARPSPGALAQAEALDAETADEWGELQAPVVRGIEFIDGKPVVIFDESDLNAFEDGPVDIKEFLDSMPKGS